MIRRTRYTRTEKGFEAWLKNCEGFLHWMVNKHYNGQLEHEDVFQEVCIAAWEGYMSYDASFGIKLTTYIGSCVRNAIYGIHAKETAKKRPKMVNDTSNAAFVEELGNVRDARIRYIDGVAGKVWQAFDREMRPYRKLGGLPLFEDC